jgi:hypothetical protein
MIFTVAKTKDEVMRAIWLAQSLRKYGNIGMDDIFLCLPQELAESDYLAAPLKEGLAQKIFDLYETDHTRHSLPADWPDELKDAAIKIRLLCGWSQQGSTSVTYLHPHTLCVREVPYGMCHEVSSDSTSVVLFPEEIMLKQKPLHDSGDHNSFLTDKERDDLKDTGTECVSARAIVVAPGSSAYGFLNHWWEIFKAGYLRGRAFLTRDASALNAAHVRAPQLVTRPGVIRFGHPQPWIRVHPWTSFISFMGKAAEGMEQTHRELETRTLLW